MTDQCAISADGVRQRLAGKRLFIFNYCHGDWAWTFSHPWHEARYVRVLDDVLELAEKDQDFRFFADSYVEFLAPYLRWRPNRAAALARLIKEKRFAIVGGQYSNVRPTTAPEETFIRNIELGRRAIGKLCPDFEPVGFANLDTAIGHSQLPQLLKLAGLEYCLAGRPELAMELDGLPKVFRWIGLDGSEIVVAVQHYEKLNSLFCGLCGQEGFQQDNWDELLVGLWKGIHRQGDVPVDSLFFMCAKDDARPGRAARDDRWLDVAKLIEHWNRNESSSIGYGTPDEFYESIKAQLDKLPAVKGAVDPAGVGYNGPMGQAGLSWLRVSAARKLVECEIYSSWAGLFGQSGPGDALENNWCELLTAQSHAAQFLLGEDISQMRLRLLNVVKAADEISTSAIRHLFPKRLPQDASAVVVCSPFPRRHRRTLAVGVVRADFQVPGIALADEGGEPLAHQAVELRQSGWLGEWTLLVDVELPACGYRRLRLSPSTQCPTFPDPAELSADSLVTAGVYRLRWRDGLLVDIRPDGRQEHIADGGSFFEPVHYPLENDGWLVTKLLPSETRFAVDRLRQIEFGPIRWAFERIGRIGLHHVCQTIYFYASGRIECRTRLSHGPEGCFIGLATPCSQDDKLVASVPFGVEDRRISEISYQDSADGEMMERLIGGMFYARDWVRAGGASGARATVVLQGDRYWYLTPDGRGLVHLLVRTLSPFPAGWERWAELDRPGYCEFRHLLVLGKEAEDVSLLSDLVDQDRFAPRIVYARDCDCLPERSFLEIEPENVRMLSWRAVDDGLEIRVVESAGQAADLRITLPVPVEAATMTDLLGRPMDQAVSFSGPQVQLALRPWQIATIRVKLANMLPQSMQHASEPMEVAGQPHIDKLGADDLAALLRFYQTLSPKIVRAFRPLGWEVPERLLRDKFARLAKGDEYAMVIRDDAGAIWGHAFLSGVLSRRAGLGIGIHQKLLGKGMGKRLMEAMIDGAQQELDLEQIELRYLKDNTAAGRLYRTNGFVVTGEMLDESDGLRYVLMRKVMGK